jgi:predicted acylesterase/phospholipase RssA
MVLFRRMAVSGGAFKLVSAIGCVQLLEERGLLESVKELAGSSAGCIVCLAICLGFSADEMQVFLRAFFESHGSSMSLINANILTSFGINDGAFVTSLLGDMIHAKTGSRDLTFLELIKTTGRHLAVCVVNLTKEKTEYFDVHTMPGLSVVTAIRVSCSIPVLLTPISINGNIYIDGGMYNNLPSDYFPNHHLNDILCVDVRSRSTAGQCHDSFTCFLKHFVYSMITKAQRADAAPLPKYTVVIETDDIGWVTEAQCKECVALGYAETQRVIALTDPPP